MVPAIVPYLQLAHNISADLCKSIGAKNDSKAKASMTNGKMLVITFLIQPPNTNVPQGDGREDSWAFGTWNPGCCVLIPQKCIDLIWSKIHSHPAISVAFMQCATSQPH